MSKDKRSRPIPVDVPLPRLCLNGNDAIPGVELGDSVQLIVDAELASASIRDYEGKNEKHQDFIIKSVSKKGETKQDKNNKIAKFMRGGQGGVTR